MWQFGGHRFMEYSYEMEDFPKEDSEMNKFLRNKQVSEIEFFLGRSVR